MNIHQACISMLDQLSCFVSEITQQDYNRPAKVLNQSTLGQHLRHTLEFFLCLQQGYKKGLVNYDKRAHDKSIETDKMKALSTLQQIRDFIGREQEDKSLSLEVGYDLVNNSFVVVGTNYFRELVYNIEHAVHHMAILKIGVCEIAPYISLPGDFGVAASTIRYKEAMTAS